MTEHSWEEAHKALCEARIEAMQVLLKAGWEPKRIALVLGFESSHAIAERWALEHHNPNGKRVRVRQAAE